LSLLWFYPSGAGPQTARKFCAITPTRRRPATVAVPTMTVSSNASRRVRATSWQKLICIVSDFDEFNAELLCVGACPAYDILMDPVRRMWFDSVDPTFDDSVPTKIKGDFYFTFGPVFERNAQYVPRQSSKAVVAAF